MTTATASISPARLQQLFPDGAPVAVAALGIAGTADPLLGAQLALAVIAARHNGPRPYAYRALDENGGTLADEADPTVVRLVALLEPELSRQRQARLRGENVPDGAELEAQHAALAALGR